MDQTLARGALGPGSQADGITESGGGSATVLRLEHRVERSMGGDAFVAKLSGTPDLAEGSIVFSPFVVEPGGHISVSDFAFNPGLGTAKPSTSRYYLSADIVKSVNDILLGSRTVPTLEPGSSSFASVTVTVPATTPLGFYTLLVCADDAKVIAERDEANNCGVGPVLQVTRPDLLETAVSEPPQTAKVGSTFSITDTAGNAGVFVAPASTTRYYLSKDGSKARGHRPQGHSRGSLPGREEDLRRLDPGHDPERRHRAIPRARLCR